MKRSIVKKVYLGICIIAGILSIITLAIIWRNESGYRSSRQQLSQMSLVGTYSVNDQNETYELNEGTKFKLNGVNTLLVKGHFTEEVGANMKVMLRIDNLKVHIKINGETVYTFGQHNKFVDYAKSGGNLWDSFVSDGIKKSDLVEIEVTNLYTNHVGSTFNTFFHNLYYGNETQYSREVLRGKLWNCFVGMVILIMGIFASVFAYVTYRLRQPIGILACFCGLSVNAGIWMFIDFEIQNTLFPSPVFNNTLEVMTLIWTAYFVLCFIAQHLTSAWRYILRVNALGFMLLILVEIPLQFLGSVDFYEIFPLVFVIGGVGSVLVLFAAVYEEVSKRNENGDLLITITSALVAVGTIVDLICACTEVSTKAIYLRQAILVFLFVEFIEIVQTFRGYIIENTKVNILEEMAYKDGLTGVKNRTAYLEKVRILEERRQEETPEFAVFFFDINNLKIVNDTLGHDHGDQLIKEVGRRIENSFGKSGLYRIGGDEFVVILEGKRSRQHKQILLEFIRQCEKEGRQIACGSSIYLPGDDHTFDDIFSRADKAMYEMKKRMKEASATS